MSPRLRLLFAASLLCSAHAAWAATNLPAFKIDPALLGLPPLPGAPKPVVPPAKPMVEAAPIAQPAPAAAPAATATPLPPPAPAVAAPLVPAAPPTPPKAVVAEPKPAPAPAPVAKPAAPKVAAPAPVEPTPYVVPPQAEPAAPISTEPPVLLTGQHDDEPVGLKSETALATRELKPGEQTPLFVSAMRIQGKQEEYIEAEEDAELRKLGLRVNADQLRYDQRTDELSAKGNVRAQGPASVVKGRDLNMKVEDRTGSMSAPEYAMLADNGHGSGSTLTFLGDERYAMDDATYSTCSLGKEAWWLRSSKLEIDRNANEGVARHAVLEFKGVPILYTPYINFPLRNERKSGLLSPTFGTTGNSGAELTLPYYWNIAPNYDATFIPRYMSKRGIELGAEFRYLKPSFSGTLQGQYLPSDQVTKTDRYAYQIQHQHNLGYGFNGNINYQRASDDNYFRDLSSLVSFTSQSILPQEGTLNWGAGPWNAGLRLQDMQVLQDPNNPIDRPYGRLPQFTVGFNKLNVLNWADMRASGEYVRFDHPTKVQGSRATAYPSISVPLTQAWGYLTPKLGYHYRHYQLDHGATLPKSSFGLPIFSADGGLTFERDTEYFGTRFAQTLEPRLYYLYVPYKDQSALPNFDSGEADFNYASIFSENRFSGGDRVSDANQVTLALTSRLIDPATGQERLRAAIGQRYFLSTPKVTLTSGQPQHKRSDFLASIGGQIAKAWSADAAWQYDPNERHTGKLNFGTRYNPEPGKVVNFAYRWNRHTLRNADISGQWPIARQWNVMGRWNYSIQDKRTLEALGGLEYIEGCWAFRIVGQRFQTAQQKEATAVFLQLEFSGLSSLGTNPTNVLKQNIGGFTQTKPHIDTMNLDEF